MNGTFCQENLFSRPSFNHGMFNAVVVICVLLGTPYLIATEPAPLVAAKAAFEAARDDVHRQKVRLTWDDGVQPMPQDLEVLVLRGYLNHDLMLLQWHNEHAILSIATVDRQWFYHPKANARSFATVTMDANTATELWQSIQAIIRVQATEIIDPDEHGKLRGASGSSSSHAAYHLLTWRSAGMAAWAALPVLRDSKYHAGIRELDEVKMTAISTLVWAHLPKEIWLKDPQEKTADRWHAWWRTILPELKGDGVTEVDQRAQLLVDDACEMLGDLGDATDGALLTDVANGLRPSQPRAKQSLTSPTYNEDSLRTAITQSTQRIALRQHWDMAQATVSIHGNRGITYTANDQERWLRQQCHQQDSQRYETLLREDLNQVNSELVVTSITELAKLYPGRFHEDLLRLLNRNEPTVVLHAAAALLGIDEIKKVSFRDKELSEMCARSKDDAQVRSALAALEHLASDPTVTIAPGAHWFYSNPRTSACEILAACPLPWGWDDERHRRQLARTDEVDGRFIHHLLSRLQLPLLSGYQSEPRKPTAAELATLIPTWRRALVTPITRGTILAMEELIALRDNESLPRISKLRDLLRAGASSLPVGIVEDETALLPWISIYEVDEFEKKLKALSDSQSAP